MRLHLHKNFIIPGSRSGVLRYNDVFVRRWFVISELVGGILNRGLTLYIFLYPGQGMPFVVPVCPLYRGLLHQGLTVSMVHVLFIK